MKTQTAAPTTSNETQKNIETCLRYFDDLSERENIIHINIEDDKLGSADRNLIGYNNKVGMLKEKNCPNAKKYEDRAVELEAIIKQANIDFKCKSITSSMEHKEQCIVDEVNKGVPVPFIVLTDVNDYDNLSDDLKEAGCVSDNSEYKTKVIEWEENLKDAEISKDPFSHYSKAVYKDDIKEIDAALANGLEINGFNSYGSFPLSVAVQHGNIDIIDYVLSKGADINLKNSDNKVALDYCVGSSVGSELTENDINVIKHLINKGAKPSLASINYFARCIIDSKQHDYFMEFEANPDVNFKVRDYISFYWIAPKGSNIEALAAKKIIAGTIGKKFSDFKAGMTNSTLNSQMMAAANDDEGSPNYTKMIISSKDWVIVRNELTGIILYRKLYGYGYGTTKDGICYVNVVACKQYYDGSNYGKTLYAGWGSRETVDCD